MSPYRKAPTAEELPSRANVVRFPWRRFVSLTLLAVTGGPFFLQMQARALVENPIDSVATFMRADWPIYLAPIGVIALIVAVLPSAEDDVVKARLCRILRSRGERGTAFGVSIGWTPLRLSRKRMDRNARAVERFVQQRRRERYPWIKE